MIEDKLHKKYLISKANGDPIDEGAEYFVLRLDTDVHAQIAAICYAHAITPENPELARRIHESVMRLRGYKSLNYKPSQSLFISIHEQLPKSGVSVLACQRYQNGRETIIRAAWIAAKTEEASYSDDDIGEYDEDTDNYYLPEGWYEKIDNWEEYTSVMVSGGEVVSWTPLPKSSDMAWASPRSEFLDPKTNPPPLGEKVLLLTEAGVVIVGNWQEGCIGWSPRPNVPEFMKQRITGNEHE